MPHGQHRNETVPVSLRLREVRGNLPDTLHDAVVSDPQAPLFLAGPRILRAPDGRGSFTRERMAARTLS
ncbi:MAG TPA: hypothetical protein VFJ72_02915 [Rubrobacteraceae bacterium]|nr:hypothetical protein [Rubrobacteraceae bacterium]